MPWASLVCKEKCSSWTYSSSASRPGSSAQCWEDHAAQLCRMLWSSVLGGWHITQAKPVLMQQLVTHTRNLVFQPSSKLIRKAPCGAPRALTSYPATQLGAPRQVGCQLSAHLPLCCVCWQGLWWEPSAPLRPGGWAEQARVLYCLGNILVGFIFEEKQMVIVSCGPRLFEDF